MRKVLRSRVVEVPVTHETPDVMLFCAYCGRATSKTEALTRKFNTGYSGCCNDNLVTTPSKGIN
jgi:GH24 family phage-related lysozyme (muramidase)